ncbi:MAG: glycoside hydrolase family 38 C-terminal domain-containing protein, partial [Ardenticatenaceae bacterium]
MDRPYIAHLIVHTHWDREWYSPFQTFRMRLVRLLDRVLSLLEEEAGLPYFHLDGQTIPLLDYLEIRPENEARLRRLVASGRLLVGPWFILPDEFLVSGESHIRNLLLGHRIARDFGHVMRTGYIPDTFGHISQLPQIFQGFNLDTTFWFRGLSGDEYAAELWWEAPGPSDARSRVLLNRLPEYIGYSNACALLPEPAAAVAELECIVRAEAERATTRHLLVMIGTDHLEPRDDLPHLLELANTRSSLAEYRFSTLEQYAAMVLDEVAAEQLATVRGE